MSYPTAVRRRRLTRPVRWAVLAAGLAGLWLFQPIDPRLLARPNDDGLTILGRDGTVLRTTRTPDGSRQRWLSLAQLDPDLLVTFVGAEDRRFYQHRGVDLLAVGRAVRQNLGSGRVVSGASTIPMQVARLLTGATRSWGGKLAQAAWAVRLDAHLSKAELLEQYLNRVPLGRGAIGVEAGARLYFGVSAADVTLAQAAMLAGLARAPSRDNPLVSLERATARRDRVLDRLAATGGAVPDEVTRARTEPGLGGSATGRLLASHFTTWVLARADSLGPVGTVRTTLDPILQQLVEAEVRHTVAQLRSFGAEQAAAVVLDNRSGGVLAWVGSPDFYESRTGQVDMVVSLRQPGSTLKPFLYGLAFDRGFTPATLLDDVSTVYSTATGPYAPRNYDRTYHGPVRIREALGSSYNVPAVEMASRLGPAALLETLHRAGFASLTRRADHYGLGLALGNGEVTLLELANGYRAIANGGQWRPVRWQDGQGHVADSVVRIMSPEAAVQTIDILADPLARLPAFGPVTPLEFGFRAAAKTGTSRHFTDNWAVAATAGFTVAVWAGNFTGRPMAGASGITGAGPLLNRVVLATASRYQPGALPLPADVGLVPVAVCRLSGMASAGRCPSLTDWFRPGTEPAPDTWFGPDGLTLPAEYAEWAGQNAMGNAVVAAGISRAGDDTARVGFRITSPRNGDRYRFVPGVEAEYATLGLRVAGAGAERVRWFVDGERFDSGRWPLEPGMHRFRAEAGPARDEVAVQILP